MKTMEINKIIEEFDHYTKENRKFIYLNKALEKFITKKKKKKKKNSQY